MRRNYLRLGIGFPRWMAHYKCFITLRTNGCSGVAKGVHPPLDGKIVSVGKFTNLLVISVSNKTNLWKFQLISLFLLRENSKNAFRIFVFILMAGVFVSRDENSLLDLISLYSLENDNTSGRNISRKAFYHRYLYTM